MAARDASRSLFPHTDPQAGEPARKLGGGWEVIGPSDCPLFFRRTLLSVGKVGKADHVIRHVADGRAALDRMLAEIKRLAQERDEAYARGRREAVADVVSTL